MREDGNTRLAGLLLYYQNIPLSLYTSSHFGVRGQADTSNDLDICAAEMAGREIQSSALPLIINGSNGPEIGIELLS